MLNGKKIGFIGGGQMCEAIVAGSLKSGKIAAQDLVVTDVADARLAYLGEKYGVVTVANDHENTGLARLAGQCGTVVVAVKPQYAREVLEALAAVLGKDTVVVSIMGGVPLATLEQALPGVHVVRTMPNTPMQVGRGIAGISGGSLATAQEVEAVRAWLSLLGTAYVLPERLIDPLTSLSGCGPAYAYLFMEALADGGVEQGLPRAMAVEMAAQLLAGAAEMALATGKHTAQLKDEVTSPGGSTIAGLHALEAGALRGTVMEAVRAGMRRTEEQGRKS